MPESASKAKPCVERSCALHSAAQDLGVCTAWRTIEFEPKETTEFDLVKILSLGNKLPSACPFIAEELLPIVRQLVRRTRRGTDELLSMIALEILDPDFKRIPPTTAAELAQFVKNLAIDELRSEHGRMRCTQCDSYLPIDRSCGRSVTATGERHPHFGRKLETHADPASLDCRDFTDRRKTSQLVPSLASPVRSVEESVAEETDVRQAMKRLHDESPFQHSVVLAHDVDELSFAEIARELRKTVDQVSYAYDKGKERLRNFLDGHEPPLAGVAR